MLSKSVHVATLLAALLLAGVATAQELVAVKIAAINDFHGNLRPPAERLVAGNTGIAAGGMARIATLVERLRARNPNFAFVSAGDLIGASPLISDFFDDEPVIEGMSLMGLDFNGVGNHEFDRGVTHLRRLQAGGCPPDGCKSGLAFAGARFAMLAANVIVRSTGKPLWPAYGIRDYGSAKVAFIGVTLKATPAIVAPQAVAGLEFRDEADTVNGLVAELKSQGVAAIVVLLHQGGTTTGGYNDCAGLRGPIIDIAQRLDSAVDIIVSAHTHQAYICRLGGRLVTSAGSYGRIVTEIDLTIDAVRRKVAGARAVNHVVSADIPENAAQSRLVERYAKLAAPLERVVGRITMPISRSANADGESTMGQLIADAHLAATADASARIAFMNAGGIRAPLEFTGAGTVTFADLFAVYPFRNTLVTMSLTGAQILRLLEQQWLGTQVGMLQVSRGFGYTWNPSLPPGGRVVQDSVVIAGERLQPDAAYRVTVNSFMAEGGDGLSVLREGRDRVAGANARDALVRYLEQNSPLAPPNERRVRKVGEQ
ncbi:MAG TPA: bifunctional metallophosphatase/5'-nucleotidase [Burkholderiales bacterium]|nr:bifunctional metallophosphatase/5'-nucleotidase [Burkholderiales bacterium]